MEVVCKLKKYKKRKNWKKLIAVLLVFVSFFTISHFWTKRVVYPTMLKIAQARINILTNDALNYAVTTAYMAYTKEDFVVVEKDASGKISMVQTNSVAVNLLTNDVVALANEKLTQMGKGGVKVPMGALFGIPFLLDGPSVRVKFFPMSSANYNYETVFESSGINQTLHKVFLNVDAEITLIYGFSNPTISVRQQLILSETIIVGEVPDWAYRG